MRVMLGLFVRVRCYCRLRSKGLGYGRFSVMVRCYGR